MPKPVSVAETIAAFCNFATTVQKDSAWCGAEINRLDKLTSDYLHQLEFGGLNYKQRAKVATQLSKCRQERRQCKNTFTNLQPFVEFLNSKRGIDMMNQLREVVGATRREERHQKHPIYIPRVLAKEEFSS